jgi:hypothetical protein
MPRRELISCPRKMRKSSLNLFFKMMIDSDGNSDDEAETKKAEKGPTLQHIVQGKQLA